MKEVRTMLSDVLAAYDFTDGPLFNLRSPLRLHGELIDQSPYLANGDVDQDYIAATVEKASDIFRHLHFNNDLLLVYDNFIELEATKEVALIESLLVNVKGHASYLYEWVDGEGEAPLPARRHIYHIDGFLMEPLFREISLTDLAGHYALASAIYLIDVHSKTIFSFYDDRGVYILATKAHVLTDLQAYLPDYVWTLL